MKKRLVLIVVLIAAAAAASAFIYRKWVEGGIRDMTYIPRDVELTTEMKLLRDYVMLDTSNPPGNEIIGARFLSEQLKAAGIEHEVFETAPGRGNVYARIRGREKGDGLLLMHHIDVDPAPPEGWKHKPFAGEVALGMLWGRGTLDMKGVGICHLAAFVDIAKSGRQPDRDIVFLAHADEEADSDQGMAWIVANRPEIFEGISWAINEGGLTEMTAERVLYFGVETGSKQTARVRFFSDSREQLLRARIYLEPFFYPHDVERIPEAVRTYFKTVAAHRAENSALLADIDRTIQEGKLWLLPDAYRALVTTQLLISDIEERDGGYSADVLVSAPPEGSLQEAIDRAVAILAPFKMRHEIVRRGDAEKTTRIDTPQYKLISDVVRQTWGDIPVGPYILPFFTTDSRYLRDRGIIAYGLSPFLVDFHQTQGIHGIDERVTLTRFAEGIEFTKKLVRRWAWREMESGKAGE